MGGLSKSGAVEGYFYRGKTPLRKVFIKLHFKYIVYYIKYVVEQFV